MDSTILDHLEKTMELVFYFGNEKWLERIFTEMGGESPPIPSTSFP
jgi:hypothetical protein